MEVHVEPALIAVDDMNKKPTLLIAVIQVLLAQKLSGHTYYPSLGSKSRLAVGRCYWGRDYIVKCARVFMERGVSVTSCGLGEGMWDGKKAAVLETVRLYGARYNGKWSFDYCRVLLITVITAFSGNKRKCLVHQRMFHRPLGLNQDYMLVLNCTA